VSDKHLPPGEPPSRSGGVSWKVVLWIVVAAYALVFLLVSSEKQDVSFVFFSVRTRLIGLILLSMALGALLARFVPHWWKQRREGEP
jgi:uncharacterized integral membrane protein